MNYDGIARYSEKSWPAGNMGGNAGVSLVPIRDEGIFLFLLHSLRQKNWVAPRILRPKLGAVFCFSARIPLE